MRSPGYAKLINWISEIWEAFEPSILAASFDQCGITSNNPVDFHNQLRHFVQTDDFVDDIQDEDGTADLPGFFSLDDHTEPTYTLDSDSDTSDSDTEMPDIDLLRNARFRFIEKCQK